MNVELVWATPKAEELIGYMARVSNPNAKQGDDASKLIKYLIDNAHWSPLEMANLCVKIETTRDISAQIIRHRSFSFQEFSQRYARVSPPEIPHFRRQDNKNRQNSFDDIPLEVQGELQVKTAKVLAKTYLLYEELLQAGVAKECARKILPMNSPTTVYMNGTLRSWVHYLKLRCDPATQEEHRYIANKVLNIFYGQFPSVARAAHLDSG